MYRYTNIRYETKIESLKNYTLFYKMLFLVFDLLFFVKDHFLLDDIKFYCYIAKNVLFPGNMSGVALYMLMGGSVNRAQNPWRIAA